MTYVKKGRPPDRYAAKKAHVLELCALGEHSREKIAAIAGVNEASVTRWRTKAGIPPALGKFKRAVIALANEGMDVKALAERTGASLAHIYRLNNDLDLKITRLRCKYG